jgi:hypothetical protein
MMKIWTTSDDILEFQLRSSKDPDEDFVLLLEDTEEGQETILAVDLAGIDEMISILRKARSHAVLRAARKKAAGATEAEDDDDPDGGGVEEEEEEEEEIDPDAP